MKQLPKDDLPLKNSPAAVKIERQLRKQLPPSDFILEYNTSLGMPEEIIAYKRFTKDRDENVCSVGNVENVKQDMVSRQFQIISLLAMKSDGQLYAMFVM